jgi:hypothetical protein
VLRDIVTSGFGGIALLGNFFESTVQDCHVTCPISATSGYGIFIDTAGGSGSGSGGVISSLTLIQNTTRGGINGVYSSTTSADVNIIGGTYLQAWEYGIQIVTAQGGYVKGAHVEANWQSTSTPAPGQAGIRAIITGNFTIENTYAVLSGGQTNSARVFMGVGSCANLVGGYQFGGDEMFRIESGAGGTATAIVSGAASISTDGNARITQLDGLRVRVPIASGRVTRINSSAGDVTPSSLHNVYNIRLTTNPTINLPSFTAVEGDELEFCFEQAGSGGNTVTWAAGYLQGSFVPTSAFGSISTIRFRYISRFASSNALFWTVISTGTT